MNAKALDQARIDDDVKEETMTVLAKMRLAGFHAVRLMLARKRAQPFDLLIPNPNSIEAMLEARRSQLRSFDSVDDLMADLDADDGADDPFQARLQARGESNKSNDAAS